MSEITEFFLKDLENYWHCEVREASSGVDLLRVLNHSNHNINMQNFKGILESAIAKRSIGVDEYKKITGLDFNTSEEVADDLQNLWNMMFK